MEKENNTIIVYTTKTPKVYKNNKLNNAQFLNFNLTDYQIFLYLISKIGGVDDEGKYLQATEIKREYILTAKEFSTFYNVDLHSCYRILKKSIEKLWKTHIKIEETNSLKTTCINLCSKVEYMHKQGTINIKFTDDIMPYLTQVKQKFVLYNLKEIANFSSLYSTRLYELIQEFKDTGWLIKSVSQLRDIFAVGNKYPLYANFKVKTFQHAVEEINNNFKINLKFEEIKNGRTISAIKFTFKSTIIQESYNPKSGNKKNIYIKPQQLKLDI